MEADAANENQPEQEAVLVEAADRIVLDDYVPPKFQVCHQCDKSDGRKSFLYCSVCLRFFHSRCVGAPTQPNWTCPGCPGPPTGTQPETDLTQRTQKLKARVRVLARVPKGARTQVAEALTTTLNQAIERGTHLTWVRLLGFAYGTLRKPPKADIRDPLQGSLTTRVKHQVAQYMGGTGDRLIEPPAPTQYQDRRKQDEEEMEAEQLRKRVAAKMADCDVKGAVRLLASSEDLAGHGEEVIQALRSKHPPAPENLNLPPAPNAQMPPPSAVTKEQVAAAVTSFPSGSAAGPDGLRPAHLKALIGQGSFAAGEKLLETLTKFVNMVLRGEIPDFVTPIFFGASLCALAKKDGGVRPIAVGNTFRRLATKVGLKPLSAGLGQHLRPVQLGFGTSGGCEAAVHATHTYLSQTQSKGVLLKIDMRNAFNSIRRDVFLRVARERIPTLYPLLWQAYAKPSVLFFGETIIHSTTGIQQGDPVGPALFSLGVDSAAKAANSELNVWYLDDATLGGSVEDVLADLNNIIRDLGDAGLEVNDRKCELILLNHTPEEVGNTDALFKEVLPGFRCPPEHQQMLLGSPLTPAAITPALTGKAEELHRLLRRLLHIDAHTALALLKNCFSIPKLQYLLRTSKAYKETGSLENIDKSIQEAVTGITNVNFSDRMWTQATLPVSLGGLGIRRATDIASPAFISSLVATKDLVGSILSSQPEMSTDEDLAEAINEWRRNTGTEEEPQDTSRSKQKAWDTISSKRTQASLLSNADQRDKARLLAAARPESGVWLHAIPSPPLGTYLDTGTVRIAVAIRVGAPVCHPHTCKCGAPMDPQGHHALSCSRSSGRLPRHSALNKVIHRALRSAQCQSTLEPAGLNRGDGRRPDGMTIEPYKNGKCLVWDATCADTFAPTNIVRSAEEAGGAAQAAEDRKRQKYTHLAGNYQFEPLGFETMGVFGPSAVRIVGEIGRKIKEATGDPRETLWLKQRLGLAILRGNALSIMNSTQQGHDTA